MKKDSLIKLINNLFAPLGFKRKGYIWILNDEDLIKIIDLQKSNYSNSFYINYGFIIKPLELNTKMHITYRLAGTNKNEQKRITYLLDLDCSISDEDRIVELNNIIIQKILNGVFKINTQEDLLAELCKRPNLNDIPLNVKRYFNLDN